MYASQLTALGIDLKNRWSGQIKTLCPRCSASRRKKNEDCLSVNIDEGVYNCKNCGWKGGVNERVYATPKPEAKLTDDNIYSWFESRKINRETVDKFGLSQSMKKFPIGGDWVEKKCICYNYYLGGQLVNIKYKTRDKDFRMVKDAKKIPYNIDSVIGKDYVIFCEGEEECMVWTQVGKDSVISAPNGASKDNNNLEWLDNVYDMLDGKKIYIAADNDEPGRKLREDLTRRFQRDLVLYITYPEQYKDGNDCLKAGVDLNALFESASLAPVPEISTAQDYFQTVLDYREKGYPQGLKVGMPETDKHISWNRGELRVITGIPGHGKSTFHEYIMNRLAFLHDIKVAFFSPEHTAPLLITTLCEQYVGKSIASMNEGELKQALYYVQDHFVFYNIAAITDFNIDNLLEIGLMMIRRYGVHSIVFDPYTYIENTESGDSNTDRIGKLLVKLSLYCKVNDVAIDLVAHPRKMDKKGNSYEVPTLYDIAGSNNFFNTPDIGTVVYRDMDRNITTLYIKKMKYHFRGKLGFIDYNFNTECQSYYEEGTGFLPICKIYKEQE